MTDKPNQSGANLPLIGVGLIVAAGAGIAVGWFARGGPAPEKHPTTQATQPIKTGSTPSEPGAVPTPAGTGARVAGAATAATAADPAGPCAALTTRICAEAGDQSPTCATVKEAVDLFGDAACSAAMGNIPSVIAKIGEMKQACTDLATRLCGELGEDTQTCAMVKEQTPKFPPERCKGMIENYPAVLAELKQMEAMNKPLTPEAQAKLAAGEAAGFGPADAKVTMVEFSDFQCPYCSMAAEAVHKIKGQYESVVRFVFRQFPLPMHSDATPAAQASLAANAQGKFWEYHDLLFQNQGSLDRASLERFAEQVGLDMTAFRAALDGSTYAAAVEADKSLGQEVGVSGTPSIFLNGERVADPRDAAAISAKIDSLLTAAGIPIPGAPSGPAAIGATPPVR